MCDAVKVTLLVESESQRPIILGAKGSAIKELSTSSRIAIEEFLRECLVFFANHVPTPQRSFQRDCIRYIK